MIWLLPAGPVALTLGALGLERATGSLRRPGQVGDALACSWSATPETQDGRQSPSLRAAARNYQRALDQLTQEAGLAA
jgi:hypothetical protein